MENILRMAKHNFAATHSDYARVGFDESSELGSIWRKNVEQFLRRIIDRGDASTQEIMRELNARAFYDFTVTEPLIAPSTRWYRRSYWDNFELKPNGSSLPLMSKLNPDLTPDLTCNGTLFQLWNIMRLSDSPVSTIRARNLLVEYLEYLGGTVEPFEDLLFFP